MKRILANMVLLLVLVGCGGGSPDSEPAEGAVDSQKDGCLDREEIYGDYEAALAEYEAYFASREDAAETEEGKRLEALVANEELKTATKAKNYSC